MKLVIIRHADPNYELDTLTETGWKEAQLLAERVSKMDVKAFYVSPLGRARDTAGVSLKKMGREATVLPWLREFLGRVEKPSEPGLDISWDWLPQDWTEEEDYYHKDKWLQTGPFAGSNNAEEIKKIYDGLDALLAEHGYVRDGNRYRAERPNEDTIVLFCHFGLECVLLSRLLNISPMPLWHGTCAAPTSVTVLNTEERREGIAIFRMSTFGDTSHLYAAGEAPSFSARFCETFYSEGQTHDY